MRHIIAKLLSYKQPIRVKIIKETLKRFKLADYETRLAIGAVERPHYGYCVLEAAKLAKQLGYREISVIEFGVAGGTGLLNLEMHVAEVKELLGVDIRIFGFDTGAGLPPPTDYRDLPHHWKQGFFEMDFDKLRGKLTRSTLVIGNVAETVSSFVEKYQPAPIAALFMDLDYYSSTKQAFEIFDLHRSSLLPRVFMYFDDIIGDAVSLFSEFTGVRLAINEFNSNHLEQKICKTTYLGKNEAEVWHDQIYIYHDFASANYVKFVSDPNQQLPLIA